MRAIFLLLLVIVPLKQLPALTPEQWKEDLAKLREAVAAHPDPFHKLKREEFDRKAEQIAASVDGMQDLEVVARMAELVAMLGDGHTRLTLPMVEGADFFLGHAKTEPPKIRAFGHFAIRLARASDGYVVTRAAPEHEDLLGAVVTSIEGKAIAQAESAMLPLVHSDNEFQRKHLLPTYLIVPELLAATGISKEPEAATWQFRLGSGETVERQLKRLGGPAEWVKLDKSPERPPEERHWFTRQAPGLIYARLTDIMDEPHESVAVFADSLFKAVASEANATLILDLRGNPGGDNTLNDAIVRGAIRTQQLWQPGRFFVLIDPGTFSAAANLAVLLERWTPAIFVGQPTGGAPNSYGDSKRTVLPHSGVTVRVSRLYWQDSTPTDNRDTLHPHLTVEPTVESLRSRDDAALKLVTALQDKPAVEPGTFRGGFAVPGRTLPLQLQFESDKVVLSVPDLKVEAQALEEVKRDGPLLEGKTKVGNRIMKVHGRLSGTRFLGWLELAGRPYAFTSEREQVPSSR